MRRIRNRRKKFIGLLTLMGAMFVLAASAAVAQPEPPTITCTGGVCLGTQGDDLILGSSDDDLILAKGGTDGVNGQGGNDRVFGGPGTTTRAAHPRVMIPVTI